MPLTLSLYGSSPIFGHLIIDRNNIIFSYPDYPGDDHFVEQSDKARRALMTVLAQVNWPPGVLYEGHSFAETEDPRHNALEHMSQHDRQSIHYHIEFANDVDMAILERIFDYEQLEKISHLISPACIKNILYTANQYFSKLYSEESARLIEKEYRAEKGKEFARYVKDIVSEQERNYLYLEEENEGKDEENRMGYHELVYWAATNDELDLIFPRHSKEIIDSRDEKGFSALHRLIIEDDLDGAERLLKAGVNVESKNNKGHTPLFSAVTYGSISAVRLLLAYHADIQYVDEYRNTLIIQAIKKGSLKLVQLLIERSNRLCDQENLNKNTPLMFAAYAGHTEIVSYLISLKCNLEQRNHMGDSAMTLAIKQNHPEVVFMLISANANIDFEISPGVSLETWAEKNKYHDVKLALADRRSWAQYDVNANSSNSITSTTTTVSHLSSSSFALTFKKPSELIERQKNIITYLIKLKEIDKSGRDISKRQACAIEQFDIIFGNTRLSKEAADYLKFKLSTEARQANSALQYLILELKTVEIRVPIFGLFRVTAQTMLPSNNPPTLSAIFKKIDKLVSDRTHRSNIKYN